MYQILIVFMFKIYLLIFMVQMINLYNVHVVSLFYNFNQLYAFIF